MSEEDWRRFRERRFGEVGVSRKLAKDISAADRREYTADEARSGFSYLIGTVVHAAAHITITRYGQPSAVIVPVEWHERAKAALAQGEAR